MQRASTQLPQQLRTSPGLPSCAAASLGAWRPGMQAYQARLMKALLKSNGNPSLRDSQGLTPLHQASYYAAGAGACRGRRGGLGLLLISCPACPAMR